MSAHTADVMTAPKLKVPLVVDVDGALVATDLLQKQHCSTLFSTRCRLSAFYWLVDGKSNLKIELPIASIRGLRPCRCAKRC